MTTSIEEKIKFLQYEKPPLEAGMYNIRFSQALNVADDETFEHTVQIAVYGERFTINQDLIHAQFPPEENLGNYSSVLPHVSFERATFPWERSAYGNDDYEPWLALLLFDEAELASGALTEPQVINLGTLKNTGSYSAHFPTIALEDSQKESDKLTVIDVKKSLLEQIAPSGEELSLLSHVRQKGKNNSNGTFEAEEEFAVVVTNRLPKSGSRSTVHLVSMEGRYNDQKHFDYGNAGANDFIRLVSLKSWSFSCLPDQPYTFEELVNNLSVRTLRLPSSTHAEAEKYLKRGYAHLPHRIRQGSKTVSWYRSPLSRRANSQTITDSIKDADQLLRYHEDIGMLDVSYASAYELGRLLALDSEEVSTALYRWKRAKKRKQRQQAIEDDERQRDAQSITLDMLALQGTETALAEQTKKIGLWFDQLNKLEWVPFNYLVPDDTMLPQESICFFQVDQLWLNCLLRGAFSIGRVTGNDSSQEAQQLSEVIQNDYSSLSGFLLRSQLVSGWPDLLVDAYSERYDSDDAIDASVTPMKPIRIVHLAEDLLLCLFEGEVKTAEVYLKPQAIQFGVDEDTPGVIKKEVRLENVSPDPVLSVPLRSQGKRVINISELAKDIAKKLSRSSITSARLGKYMIEGTAKGRFVKSS